VATRDYKKRTQAKRAPAKKSPVPGWVWLLAGLAVGLLVAFLIWLDKVPTPKPAPARTAAEKPAPAKAEPKDTRSVKKEAPAKAPDAQAKEERKGIAYDFYTLLPEMEVPVPDNEPAARGLPPAPVAPGNYVVQVGAFRTLKDADARKAELALLGLVSTIQVITIDSNTLHRVRIGPLSDMNRLDQVRNTLKQNDIPFMLLREKS
jgi:cell division protein FtsN